MRRLLAWCAAIGLLASMLVTSPALAAGEKPSPELDRFYLRLSTGQRAIARMAGCQIHQKPESARALFDHEPGSPEYVRARDDFFEDASGCLFLPLELRGATLMFMGGIAEQLILEDKPARPLRAAPALSSGSSLELGGGSHLWTWRNLSDLGAGRLLPLAACLLERHGDQIEAVLDARPTSNGERVLFNALNDEIDRCIPAGELWTLQPQLLRGAFAVAYYKSARAAANSSGAAG